MLGAQEIARRLGTFSLCSLVVTWRARTRRRVSKLAGDRGRADVTIDICGDVRDAGCHTIFVDQLNLCILRDRPRFLPTRSDAVSRIFSHDTLCAVYATRLLSLSLWSPTIHYTAATWT